MVSLQKYLLFPEILSVSLLRSHLLNFGHNTRYQSIYLYLYIGVDISDLRFLIVTLYGILSRTYYVTSSCSYAHKSQIWWTLLSICMLMYSEFSVYNYACHFACCKTINILLRFLSLNMDIIVSYKFYAHLIIATCCHILSI